MISFEHHCIFIHIPKTAGTSIEQKLGLFKVKTRGIQDHSTIRDFEPKSWIYLLREKSGFIKNHPDKQVENQPKKRNTIPIDKYTFRTFYKFTFIRNPWSRTYSWYQGILRDDIHKNQMGINNPISLLEFLQVYGNTWPLNPQVYWLKNNSGKIKFDFIGRFENLTEDFSKVSNTLGLSDPILPRLLISDNRDYRLEYDSISKDIVYRKYREEIKLFNYDFDDC